MLVVDNLRKSLPVAGGNVFKRHIFLNEAKTLTVVCQSWSDLLGQGVVAQKQDITKVQFEMGCNISRCFKGVWRLSHLYSCLPRHIEQWTIEIVRSNGWCLRKTGHLDCRFQNLILAAIESPAKTTVFPCRMILESRMWARYIACSSIRGLLVYELGSRMHLLQSWCCYSESGTPSLPFALLGSKDPLVMTIMVLAPLTHTQYWVSHRLLQLSTYLVCTSYLPITHLILVWFWNILGTYPVLIWYIPILTWNILGTSQVGTHLVCTKYLACTHKKCTWFSCAPGCNM